MSPGARLLALTVAAGCLGVLIVAARLEPNPRGVGTHTGSGLGLNECALLQKSGLPCPSCGMTTSFSWFVRGNLAASLYVQPMGTALALAAAACVWGGFYAGATGRPVHRLLRLLPGRYYLLPALVLGVLAWSWKIYLHVNGLDGWG